MIGSKMFGVKGIVGLIGIGGCIALGLAFATTVSGQPIPTAPQDRYERNVRLAFVSGNRYDGRLGGLIGADEKCNSDPNRPIKSLKYRAYLPGATDWTRVYPGAEKLLVSWSESDIDTEPNYDREIWDFGELLSTSQTFWGGWNSYPDTCSDWTTSSGSGGVSDGIRPDGELNYALGTKPCSGTRSILCIEWSE